MKDIWNEKRDKVPIPIKPILEILQEVHPDALNHDYAVISIYRSTDFESSFENDFMEPVKKKF